MINVIDVLCNDIVKSEWHIVGKIYHKNIQAFAKHNLWELQMESALLMIKAETYE